MKNKKTLYLVQAAMIAALYVVLTMIAHAFGLDSGAIQIRLSEMLSVLPFLPPPPFPVSLSDAFFPIFSRVHACWILF